MRRPRREFRAECFALEGRSLLAVFIPHVHVQPSVGFEGTAMAGTHELSQVVTQQDGEATVSLTGYIEPGGGTFQVEVATDPSSPAVGVNVGAVDQMVSFTHGTSQPTLTVPILAGAPNPGEVDVELTITPINAPPDLKIWGPLKLRILASREMIPPKIVSVEGEAQAIVLTFSKPMDPAGASNVKNYVVRWETTSTTTNPLGLAHDVLTLAAGGGAGIRVHYHTRRVPLRAAEYDPATNSVTLIPKRKLNYHAGSITVTQGQQTKASGGPGLQSQPGPGLTDLAGNRIKGDMAPGKFYQPVFLGAYQVP